MAKNEPKKDILVDKKLILKFRAWRIFQEALEQGIKWGLCRLEEDYFPYSEKYGINLPEREDAMEWQKILELISHEVNLALDEVLEWPDE